MMFPADRTTVFLGVLSWFFSSSPQNRTVSFPSARTCEVRVRSASSGVAGGPARVSSTYLNVVVLTPVGGLQAEVGEIESDPVARRGRDVPHPALVVRVRMGEVGGGEAAVRPCHFHTRRDNMEEGKQDKHAAPAGPE